MPSLRDQVRQRAKARFEYCQLPQTCTVLPQMFPARYRVNYDQTRNRKPPQSFYALFYAFSIPDAKG
jgi:hypothetical protein